MPVFSKYALGPKNCKVASFLAVAALTGWTGFLIHVLTVDVIQNWLFGEFIGTSYTPGVMLLAAITSLEVGVGLTLLYCLVRHALQQQTRALRAVSIAAILLAVQGILARQLLMDQIVGGFTWQSFVSDLLRWPTWIGMCFVLVWAYEWLVPHGSSDC